MVFSERGRRCVDYSGQCRALSTSSCPPSSSASNRVMSDQKQEILPPVPAKDLRTQFVCAAVPLIGFGFMDNTIMLRAGELIDSTLGVTFGLATLTAAAVGQLCSDTSGIVFGGWIEAMAQRLGLPTPNVTPAQRQQIPFKVVTTAGAAVGVCFGCLLGMANLLFMNVDKAERQKKQKELDTIFEMVMSDGPKMFDCERVTLFLYDKSKEELWSKVVSGEQEGFQIVLKTNAAEQGFTRWVFYNKTIVNVREARKDARFDPSVDHRTGFVTRSVLAGPVVREDGEVDGVIMLLNKHNSKGFTKDDERMLRMLANHVRIFMDKFEHDPSSNQSVIFLRALPSRVRRAAESFGKESNNDTTVFATST